MHRITINDTTVICNDVELNKLNNICLNFTGDTLRHRIELEQGEEQEQNRILTFAELNRPEPKHADLNISYWGEEGSKPNDIADLDSQRYYGCYFNVLIFLDGCDTFFRGTE